MNSDSSQAETSLRDAGYALLSATQLAAVTAVHIPALEALRDSWDRLPPDEHLRDGGHYRSRRHSSYVQALPPRSLSLVAHRAHWQPTTYNALHGGIERWFEPIEPRVTAAPVWRRLIASLGELFAQARPTDRWYIEAHQFRIDTANGIGRPTPEGAHRDGVDFVAVILVGRRNLRGGETRVFDAHGSSGVRFTMEEPWSALLMDDERVIHETTPIQPEQSGGNPEKPQRGDAGQPEGVVGARDTLVLTYRANGFQAP